MTKLYYESHVTIEPVFGSDLDQVSTIASRSGFKVADLLMKRERDATERRSDKDTFMTTRDTDKDQIILRTTMVVHDLRESGFKVWRYKIEDTVLDSRYEDVLDLLS